MTRLAFFSFLAVMLVFLFVAGIAISFELRLVFVQLSLVAALALDFMMLAQQGIFGGFAVIEQDFFPTAIGMACHAFQAKIAFVFVILLVTVVAFQRGVLVCAACVAGTAFHADVLAKDFESGLAMIEMQCLPVLLFMAALACFAQRAFVLVLLGVTTIACLCNIPEFFARRMTILAQDFFRKMPAL
jgi:hypothetical protein